MRSFNLLCHEANACRQQPLPIHTSSFLRHGSKFAGTQQSDRQVYNVQVEIKYVDMGESFICGYLRIEGIQSRYTRGAEYVVLIHTTQA